MCDWPVSASKSVFSPEKLWGTLQLYTQGIEVDLSFPPLASEEYARFFSSGLCAATSNYIQGIKRCGVGLSQVRN